MPPPSSARYSIDSDTRRRPITASMARSRSRRCSMAEKDFREATEEWVMKFAKMSVAMEEINTYRGRFLARMIFIEEMLDNWIIDYFIPDDGIFFAEQVLTRIRLDGEEQRLGVCTRRLGRDDEVHS